MGVYGTRHIPVDDTNHWMYTMTLSAMAGFLTGHFNSLLFYTSSVRAGPVHLDNASLIMVTSLLVGLLYGSTVNLVSFRE